MNKYLLIYIILQLLTVGCSSTGYVLDDDAIERINRRTASTHQHMENFNKIGQGAPRTETECRPNYRGGFICSNR
jgi:hypothetical protein